MQLKTIWPKQKQNAGRSVAVATSVLTEARTGQAKRSRGKYVYRWRAVPVNAPVAAELLCVNSNNLHNESKQTSAEWFFIHMGKKQEINSCHLCVCVRRVKRVRARVLAC